MEYLGVHRVQLKSPVKFQMASAKVNEATLALNSKKMDFNLCPELVLGLVGNVTGFPGGCFPLSELSPQPALASLHFSKRHLEYGICRCNLRHCICACIYSMDASLPRWHQPEQKKFIVWKGRQRCGKISCMLGPFLCAFPWAECGQNEFEMRT